MEALSPKSPDKGSAPRLPSAGPSGQNAPSVLLPLSFVLLGCAALLTGMMWLVARPTILAGYHYNQIVIAVTHLFVLGWICSVVMGAMYQLVPVALETRLHSERLAWCQMVLHGVGFIGMVWMFCTWNMKHVGHFGSVLALGVGLFVYNLARTLRRVPRWNVSATAVAAALLWISLTITAGLVLALGKSAYDADGLPITTAGHGLVGVLLRLGRFTSHFDAISAMHAHAHLGGVGLFTMLIVGVSYKLIPMFTLSELQSPRRAVVSVALLNLGLAGAFVTILLRSPWKLAWALVVIVALGVYGWELAAILRARKRRVLDWGIRYFLTAVGLYVPLSTLSIVLNWPGLPSNHLTGQLENIYGFLGLLGVVSFAIIGMLYKIVPFLVWFGRYSKQIGRAQVPSLADLYSTKLQVLGYWSYLLGLAVASVAILRANEASVRLGSALLALGVFTLLINIGLMLSHYFAPSLKPLTIEPARVPKTA